MAQDYKKTLNLPETELRCRQDSRSASPRCWSSGRRMNLREADEEERG